MAQQQSSLSTLAATGNLNPTGGGGSSGSGGGGGGGGGGAATGGGGNANSKLLGGEPEHFKGD